MSWSEEQLAELLDKGKVTIADSVGAEARDRSGPGASSKDTATPPAPATRRQIERGEQEDFVKASESIIVREGGVLREYLLMIPNALMLSYVARTLGRDAMLKLLGSMRRQGFSDGAADVLIFLPRDRFNLLWLEFKKPESCFPSRRAALRAVTPAQQAFGKTVQRAGGLWYAVYGCTHAIDQTRAYLGGIRTPA